LIVSKDEVVGVNFMGSSSEGAKIAALAGKYIKKTSLQLSSSDAMVVLDDANVHLAVQNAIKIGLFNSGQGPTPKRFIVRAEVYNLFKDLLI
jgi:succinate-semialdehyde dehydrogenase/glutarate-semialdehyde dehydrogenase